MRKSYCKNNLLEKTLLTYFLFATFFGFSKPPKRDVNAASPKEPPTIHPNYTAYHKSDSVTKIYFSVNSKELLYMRYYSEKTNLVARVKITCKLFSGYGASQIIDSVNVFFTDTVNTENPSEEVIYGNFEVRVSIGNTAVAEIIMTDANRNNESFTYLTIDKKNNRTRQNFFVSHANSNQPLFTNYVTTNDTISINYNKQEGLKKIFVKFFKQEFPLPPPPFSYQERKPINTIADSVFTVALNESYCTKIYFVAKGIYYFVTDTSSANEGLTIVKYNHNLPALDDATSMLKSLRFITTKQEYDELLASNNLKSALDKYWLTCSSNNKEKARTLIKNYYTRIEKCNTFFTSYDEGWKTDRGLIYLIFGAPNSVTRENHSETWVYGDNDNPSQQITFVFTKMDNPFSDNDYVLNRSENYKELWYKNVDAWRMGRIINEK